MNPKHGLSKLVIARVVSILSKFPEVQTAILFGSRAKATHKPGSDIDLALIGETLHWRTIGKIYEAFDDSLLPYRFSLIHWNSQTDADVAAHIRRVGIPLYETQANDPERVKHFCERES